MFGLRRCVYYLPPSGRETKDLVVFSEGPMSLFSSWIRIPIWQQRLSIFSLGVVSSCEHDTFKGSRAFLPLCVRRQREGAVCSQLSPASSSAGPLADCASLHKSPHLSRPRTLPLRWRQPWGLWELGSGTKCSVQWLVCSKCSINIVAVAFGVIIMKNNMKNSMKKCWWANVK